jgi:hypothetical protein
LGIHGSKSENLFLTFLPEALIILLAKCKSVGEWKKEYCAKSQLIVGKTWLQYTLAGIGFH